jgi:glycosyltransferase involved in cell wall biosynthesis
VVTAAPRRVERRAICLDQRVLGLGGGTGVATYAANLRLAVAAAGFPIETLSDAPPGAVVDTRTLMARMHRWAVAAGPWQRVADCGPSAANLRITPDIFRIAQIHFDIHRSFVPLRSQHPPAVMHWSYPLPIRLAGCPNVVTVHDVIPLRHPDLSPIKRSRWRRLLMRLRQEADHIVTVSEASRRDIIRELGWPEARVTNTYQSVELPDWSVAEADAATRAATESAGVEKGKYMLHIGTIERRKNIARLIEAHRASGIPQPLVLAGPEGWEADTELLPLSGPHRESRVIRMPWLERRTLLALLRGARALVAPSLAEGFGLPAVEAMALGVPVMTSAIDASGAAGATAEIAGEAALLVDPTDVREMAQGLRALATDDALCSHYIALGSCRARYFSRDAHAERLKELYTEVAIRSQTGRDEKAHRL